MTTEINAAARDALAAVLKLSRERADLSQEQIAAAVGVSKTAAHRYETAKQRPPLAVIAGWAVACGLSARLRIGTGDPVAIGDEQAVRFALDAARSTVGIEHAVPSSTAIDLGSLVWLADAADMQVWIVWGES